VNDSGSYSVVVTNVAGTATSTNATLLVSTCTVSLQSINVSSGTDASLAFNVDPANSYTFEYKDNLTDAQWQQINAYSPAGSTLQVSDLGLTNTQRFYRLEGSCSATPPCGFVTLSLLGNSDTFVSMPFVRPAASPEQVGSITDNTVTVVLPPGQSWTSNQFVYVSGSQSNTYYARFASGALNGIIFPVTANDTNTLTLDLNGGSLSNAVANDLIYVEPYWTLNSIFPGGAGVNISPTVGNRNTEILVPDLTSPGINLSASNIYYFHNGLWKLLGDGNVDHGNDTLQPNTYFVVRHNVSTNTTLFAAGSVIAADTAVALNIPATTTNKQDNYIALTRPITLSLDNSQLISSGAFVPSPLPGSRTDELLVFDNSAAAKNKSAVSVYYYWNNAWRRVGAGSTAVGGDTVFTPGTGMILRKGTNAPATWLTIPTY
jgi:uncharacterized protein (TIGR02597 family)